jgi:Family of unknown function (DUF5302)
MTESAKQDTTKPPAEPAATESAATESAGTKGEATQETAAEPAEAAAATAGEPAKPDLDETKRMFREALERKHQAHNEGQGKGGREGGKISGAHGPAASRRNFRRKSG